MIAQYFQLDTGTKREMKNQKWNKKNPQIKKTQYPNDNSNLLEYANSNSLCKILKQALSVSLL